MGRSAAICATIVLARGVRIKWRPHKENGRPHPRRVGRPPTAPSAGKSPPRLHLTLSRPARTGAQYPSASAPRPLDPPPAPNQSADPPSRPALQKDRLRRNRRHERGYRCRSSPRISFRVGSGRTPPRRRITPRRAFPPYDLDDPVVPFASVAALNPGLYSQDGLIRSLVRFVPIGDDGRCAPSAHQE